MTFRNALAALAAFRLRHRRTRRVRAGQGSPTGRCFRRARSSSSPTSRPRPPMRRRSPSSRASTVRPRGRRPATCRRRRCSRPAAGTTSCCSRCGATRPRAISNAKSAETIAFRKTLQPMLYSPYDERPHAGLMVAGGQTAKGAMYVVTHVDIIPTEQFPPCKRQVSDTGPCRHRPGPATRHRQPQASRHAALRRPHAGEPTVTT